MRKIVSTLAVAFGLLSSTAPVIVEAETASIPANGTWTNVTPNGVDLANPLSCDNFGAITMVVDPARQSNLYTQFHCQGVWKSVDYGLTWFGPINTGRGGAGASGAGGLAIARGLDGKPPIIYWAGNSRHRRWLLEIRGRCVSWANYRVAPGRDRQASILLRLIPLIRSPHHERTRMNLIVESHDEGRTWSSVPMADGMHKNTERAFCFSSTLAMLQLLRTHGFGQHRVAVGSSGRGVPRTAARLGCG